MATDYDSPRGNVADELDADSLEGLKAAEASNSSMDDDGEIVDSFEPPLIDVSGEEINVSVVPRKDDEFTCGSCFLVQSKKRIAYVEDDGSMICLDCE
ncbi:Uncharacterised protein [Corynebacterium renale]|uniref:DUF4193 domain-containing protein n=1 Tax=Corynebacterium renale TaxID=1724 RepID=UPI000DA38FD0|nr:DUF4193 domain-containing protein [Corynebacterium renale]SQG64821.1 Uncharacterised protein [Corynebacterium renale]